MIIASSRPVVKPRGPDRSDRVELEAACWACGERPPLAVLAAPGRSPQAGRCPRCGGRLVLEPVAPRRAPRPAGPTDPLVGLDHQLRVFQTRSFAGYARLQQLAA